MEYLDFELAVDTRSPGEYEVRVRAPTGEVRNLVRRPFEQSTLAQFRQALSQALRQTRAGRDFVSDNQAPQASPAMAVRRFGQAMFDMLLSGDVLLAYRASLLIAARSRRGVRIQLRMQTPELASLPWELMFDPEDGSFVCLNPTTPVVRYPEIGRAPELLGTTPPLRILGMMSSPRDLPPLDKERERRWMEKALAEPVRQGRLVLQWTEGGSYSHLQAAMRGGPWHVLHFIGHGAFEGTSEAGGGVLALESASAGGSPNEQPSYARGLAHFIPAEAISQLLRGHPTLRLVLLNSCLGARGSDGSLFTSTAETLVRRGVPAVIAMQHEISDHAAIAFAHAFYTSLAAAAPVDLAVTDARAALNAENSDSLEWSTPVLLMRSPTGTIIEPSRTVTQDQDATDRRRQGNENSWGRRRRGLALVLALPLILLVVLALRPAPEAGIELVAEVTGVRLRLSEPQSLDASLNVTSLGISGIEAISLPSPAGDGEPMPAEKLALTSRGGTREGRIRMDLTRILPARTLVELRAGYQAGTYEMQLADSVPDLAVVAIGPVMLATEDAEVPLDFPTPALLALHGDGELGLEFTPVSGNALEIAPGLRVESLDLVRMDQYATPDGTTPQDRSTIRKGTLAIEGAGARQLERGDLLGFDLAFGTITRLTTAGDHLRLTFRGRVSDVAVAEGAGRQSLMPSRLAAGYAKHGVRLAIPLALYLVTVAMVATWWPRRIT